MAINIGKVTFGNLWKSHTEVFNLIMRHLNRYPKMEAQDIYTLIYQGAMGASYFADDAESFEERLLEEFARVEGDQEKPLWESIRPDGELVRVHMAGLKGRGGKAQKLVTLSLWTVSVFRGDRDDMANGWETFSRICAEKRLSLFKQEEIETITKWAVENNYPSTRHSRTFREAYHPHYRLVKREFLQTLLENS
jgi:hypothetical protein